MLRLMCMSLLLVLPQTSGLQNKPYSDQPQPLHAWDTFMADPQAVAEGRKFAGRCGDAPNQAVMNACNQQEAHVADAALNRAYHAYQSKLDPAGRERLQRIERLWLQYRDVQCKEDAAQFEGGSLQPTEFYSCITSVTRQRIADMASAYGDLGK